MVRVVWCMSWLALAGCGSDSGSTSDAGLAEQVDASAPMQPQAADAGASPAKHVEVDLDTLVAAFFTEYAHEVSVTCPCRVQQHLFASVPECERQFGGDPRSLIDCAARSLAPSDTPELRASLRCNVELYSRRADCLERHSCAMDDMNTCYDTVPDDCGPMNGEAFTAVFYNCVMNALP